MSSNLSQVTEWLQGQAGQALKSRSVYPQILLEGTVAGCLRLQVPQREHSTRRPQ